MEDTSPNLEATTSVTNDTDQHTTLTPTALPSSLINMTHIYHEISLKFPEIMKDFWKFVLRSVTFSNNKDGDEDNDMTEISEEVF